MYSSFLVLGFTSQRPISKPQIKPKEFGISESLFPLHSLSLQMPLCLFHLFRLSLHAHSAHSILLLSSVRNWLRVVKAKLAFRCLSAVSLVYFCSILPMVLNSVIYKIRPLEFQTQNTNVKLSWPADSFGDETVWCVVDGEKPPTDPSCN